MTLAPMGFISRYPAQRRYAECASHNGYVPPNGADVRYDFAVFHDHAQIVHVIVIERMRLNI